MKRFALALILTCVLSASAFAGDIPTAGVASTPPPPPTTQSTSSSIATTILLWLVARWKPSLVKGQRLHVDTERVVKRSWIPKSRGDP